MKWSFVLFLTVGIFLFSACGSPKVSEEKTSTPMYTLTVNINPTGAGSVSPPGGKYESGVQVTITATPTSNYVFDYWDGSISDSASTVAINMNSNNSVTAHFKHVETPSTSTSPPSTNTEVPNITNFTVNILQQDENGILIGFTFFNNEEIVEFTDFPINIYASMTGFDVRQSYFIVIKDASDDSPEERVWSGSTIVMLKEQLIGSITKSSDFVLIAQNLINFEGINKQANVVLTVHVKFKVYPYSHYYVDSLFYLK